MSDDNPGWPSDQTPPPPGQNPPPSWGSAYPSPPPTQPQYGQQPHGQPSLGQYGPPPPKHPQATTAMILGILGLLLCGLIAPFAWSMGAKAVREIDASPGMYSGRSEANAGKIMGIIECCLLVAILVFVLISVIIAVGASTV